jgi:hypothetical protein
VLCADIGKEKTEQELRKSIGEFDKSNLKHQKVQEKNPLPGTDGRKPGFFFFFKQF